jgi:hypothetical protein
LSTLKPGQRDLERDVLVTSLIATESLGFHVAGRVNPNVSSREMAAEVIPEGKSRANGEACEAVHVALSP